MKKISFENLGINSKDLLSRERLKSIIGGYGSGDDYAKCTATCVGTYGTTYVSCSGTGCRAEDNKGCYSYEDDGSQTLKPCTYIT